MFTPLSAYRAELIKRLGVLQDRLNGLCTANWRRSRAQGPSLGQRQGTGHALQLPSYPAMPVGALMLSQCLRGLFKKCLSRTSRHLWLRTSCREHLKCSGLCRDQKQLKPHMVPFTDGSFVNRADSEKLPAFKFFGCWLMTHQCFFKFDTSIIYFCYDTGGRKASVISVISGKELSAFDNRRSKVNDQSDSNLTSSIRRARNARTFFWTASQMYRGSCTRINISLQQLVLETVDHRRWTGFFGIKEQ